MKKTLLLCFLTLTSSLFAVDKYNIIEEKKVKVDDQIFTKPSTYYELLDKKRLEHTTKVRTYNSLKMEQGVLEDIIYKFEILEKSLKNFEEKKVVNQIKMDFVDKYIIKQVDVLDINTRMNEVIH